MKSRLIILFCICFLSVNSQESDLFQLWPDTVLAKANSAAQVSFMNEEEKLVVYYINLCRINPSLFEDTFLKDYLKENKIKKDKEIKELISILEETSPRVILKPDEKLTSAARLHAQDMGETGRTGHNGSDGTPFKDRIEHLSNTFSTVNENANYGNEHALDIVVDLLIDRNVPNAGHRKNILDIESRYIGVAIAPHKRFRFNCVQEFGGAQLEH